MLSIIVLLAFLASAAADGYVCTDDPINLAPPDDLTKTTYWPSDWNDSLPPIPFPVNQLCKWQVSVPQGYYATVTFYKIAPTANIYLQYANVQTESLSDNDHYPFVLTAPSFDVTLFKTATAGSFSFKITWSKYPDAKPLTLYLKKGGEPIAQPPDAFLTTFSADTKVSFVAFQLKDSTQNALLRQSAVYDGDSTNGKFLGNLGRIMATNKQVISTGTTLTVYTFGLGDVFNYNLYMAQDHSNDEQFLTYQAVNCASDTQCPIELNARFGPSALATVAPRDFIKSIEQFPENATFKIYEGVVSDQTLVTTLTSANYKTRLPMELKNTMRQYTIDSGRILLHLSRDANDAKWNQLYDGRKGFVHSSYHGVLSIDQATDETFTTGSTDKLYLNYIVRDADFTGAQTALTVSVFVGGKQVSSTVYNSTNMPPTTTVSVQGDTFGIKYDTFNVPTNGFRLDFSTTSTGFATTVGTSTPRATSTASTKTQGTTPATSSATSSSSAAVSSSTARPSTASSTPKHETVRTSTSRPTTATGVVETTTKSSSIPSSILIITGSLLLVLS